MSELAQFRSLYWRIALGFVAMLATVLVLQGALFLWLTGRFAASPSSRTPQELADEVARELSDALAEDDGLDLNAYVHDRFGAVRQPFLVVMRDGRRASNRPGVLPPGFGAGSNRRRGQFPLHEPGSARTERGDPGRGAPEAAEKGIGPEARRNRSGPAPRGYPSAPEPGRRRGGPRGPANVSYSPILLEGSQVGHVAVPAGQPPIEIALRELGPTLTWSALGLLSIGAIVTALLIFRPAHRRLRSLEDAARALGAGRTDVRADERGGDEVSALARAFNQMAAGIQARDAALAASDRARRQLLADVSHELMTPLTAIRGYTQTLAMPELALDDATRARYFEIVDRETYKLEAVIGDLLDLARLEGGGGALSIENVEIAELFRRVADRHEPALRSRGIVLGLDVPEGLQVPGDLHRLEQALQNVVSNAIRHSGDGGRIELHAGRDGEAVRIAVRDGGPGIPPEHLPHVFDRFYKVDAARTAAGSGLGLSIVRAIVERHGGTVRASNAPEGGAVFEILLPARPAAA